MGKCEICENAECVVNRNMNKPNTIDYDCPNCGSYNLPSDDYNILKREYADKKHLIAGYLYEFYRDSENVFNVTGENLKSIFYDGHMPKTPMQRLERFLLNMYKSNDTIGLPYSISGSGRFDEGDSFYSINGKEDGIEKMTWYPLSMAYARNIRELKDSLDCLNLLGYLMKTEGRYYSISPKGFERAEQLLNTNIDSKSVFVAMWFNKDMDEVYENIIVPAIEKCGFRAIRVDKKEHNNNITDEIIAGIKQSKFVIADLTGHRGGVYYEAGYARGLGREVILTCRNDEFEKRHFDIAQINTIIWEIDKQEEFKHAIIKRIEATIL